MTSPLCCRGSPAQKSFRGATHHRCYHWAAIPHGSGLRPHSTRSARHFLPPGDFSSSKRSKVPPYCGFSTPRGSPKCARTAEPRPFKHTLQIRWRLRRHQHSGSPAPGAINSSSPGSATLREWPWQSAQEQSLTSVTTNRDSIHAAIAQASALTSRIYDTGVSHLRNACQ